MTTEKRGNKLAVKIIIAALKIVLPDIATRAEGILEIAEVLGGGEPSSTRTLIRLLEDNADHLRERLAPLEENEFDVADNERDLAIEGVCRAIDELSLTKSDLIKMGLDSAKLFNQVRPIAESRWQSTLIAGSAVDYGLQYLSEACDFLTSMVRRLPDFRDEMLVQEYSLTYKIHEMLESAINSVVQVQRTSLASDQTSSFEAKYRSHIMDNYSTMELFGLGVPSELRQRRIDVAYITLMASKPIKADIKSNDDSRIVMANQSSDIPESTSRLPVDEALAELVKANYAYARQGALVVRNPPGVRVLLTGPAGSGKTTIAQWLAVKAGEHNFPEPLGVWNSCTPLVIPLRDVFKVGRAMKPGMDDLVQPQALRESLPANWLESKLAGDSLIIFDGLDELSEASRVAFDKWLTEISTTYIFSNIVVTARPEGLDRRSLELLGFIELELMAMGRRETRSCIDAWFKCLLLIARGPHSEHLTNKSRLIRDLDRQAALRELATTPLLCSMLCSFYAYNRSAAAPQGRTELYSEVVRTLVDTRERYRNPDRDDLRTLQLRPKLVLLQALARYMSGLSLPTLQCSPDSTILRSNEWPGSTVSTAQDIIEDRLQRMSFLQVTADEALDILLRRSIVFRRVGYNDGHFVHRSLQEYLTACDYAADGNVTELLAHCRSSDWWNIIAFAAGKLQVPQASDLISGLMASAEADEVNRRSLLLLAGECYLAAGSVDPPVAERVKMALQELLPPRNIDEAEMVAHGGADMLPFLKAENEYPEEVLRACIHAASLVGGEAGLQVIKEYARSTAGQGMLYELLDGWQCFDPETYVNAVLSVLDLSEIVVPLRTKEIMEAAARLSNLTLAQIEADETAYGTDTWACLSRVRELYFAETSGLVSLSGIRLLHNLRTVDLAGARKLQEGADLGRLGGIQQLNMSDCSSLVDGSYLGELGELRVLILDGCTGLSDFSWVARLTKLMTLSLNNCRVSDLSFCADLKNLRTLRVDSLDGVMDTSALMACDGLRRLDVNLSGEPRDPLILPVRGRLTDLRMHGSLTMDDLADIGRYSEIGTLSIRNVRNMRDLSWLRGLDKLANLSAVDCYELSNAMAVYNMSKLTELDLSGSLITDADFVQRLGRLTRISLNRCAKLRDISALAALPALEYVSLIGCSRDVSPSPDVLRQVSVRPTRMTVVHDPLVLMDSRLFRDDKFYGPTA